MAIATADEQRIYEMILQERSARDPLRQYVPHTQQLKFIRAVLQGPHYENWAITANRWGKCITYQTLIDTLDGKKCVGDLFESQQDFWVSSWDGEKIVQALASPVFQKPGLHECYRVTMSDGSWFECADDHRILTAAGWQCLSQSVVDVPSPLATSLESALSIHASSAHRLRRRLQGCLDDYFDDSHLYDGLPHVAISTGLRQLLLSAGARPHNPALCTVDVLARICTNTLFARSFRLSIQDVLDHFEDQYAQYEYRNADIAFPPYRDALRDAPQLSSVGASQLRSIDEFVRYQIDDIFSALLVPPVLTVGRNEIVSCQPIGRQEVYDFTVPVHHNYVTAGVVHHNSDAGAYCGATLARYGIEPTKPAVGATTTVWDRATSGWIVGPDHETMVHTIIPKYVDNGSVPPGSSHRPFIPEWEVESWNQSTQSGKLKNGSLIQTKSNEQKQIKFSAAGVDWVHCDEEPAYDNYEEMTLRIEAGRRLRIFGTCTLLPPEGQVGGVSWLYSKIIQPFQSGENQRVNVQGGSIYENPHLLPDEIAGLEARYPVGTLQRRIRLDGEWLPGLGGARKYPQFSAAIHLRPQAAPNPYLPLCWWWDFNVAPLCTGVGQYIRGRFHGYKEFVMDEGSTPEMVELFRQTYPKHPHEIWIYGDASGSNRGTQTVGNQSDYTVILNAMRTYPSLTRLKVPQSNPFVADRVNSVNVAFQDENGESRVELDPSMVEHRADFEQVIDDGRGGIKKTTNPRDPYSRRTHTSDGFGYFVWAVAPVKSNNRSRRGAIQIPQPGYAWSR